MSSESDYHREETCKSKVRYMGQRLNHFGFVYLIEVGLVDLPKIDSHGTKLMIAPQ